MSCCYYLAFIRFVRLFFLLFTSKSEQVTRENSDRNRSTKAKEKTTTTTTMTTTVKTKSVCTTWSWRCKMNATETTLLHLHLHLQLNSSPVNRYGSNRTAEARVLIKCDRFAHAKNQQIVVHKEMCRTGERHRK